MELCLRAKTEAGLTSAEIRTGMLALLQAHPAKRC